jgi:hypothetical protein
MKLATQEHTRSTNLSNASGFGIQKEDMSHVIGILRSKIYSNKWLAVLREYCTNAIDSHVEAGIPDTPIKVTLPTLSSPVIKIRDYGNGLTDEEVRKIYIMYGASTKRSSNDYTGCLGIGCKALFSYTDQFTISTYDGQVRNDYTAVIDDSSQGELFHVATVPAPGEQGVEVSAAVDSKDITEFEKYARQLFPYFKVMPECNLDIKPLEKLSSGDSWYLLKDTESTGYYRNQGKTKALMGNIPYDIDIEKMSGNRDYSDILGCKNLVIKFNLGALDIAASRESLEYTPRTCQAIEIEASKVIKSLQAQLSTDIAKCNTYVEASHAAQTIIDALPHGIRDRVFMHAKWQGQELRNKFQSPLAIVAHMRKHRYRSGDYVNGKTEESWLKIKPNHYYCRYNPDKMSQAQATRRVRTLQHEGEWDKEAVYYMIPMKKINTISGIYTREEVATAVPLAILKGNIKVNLNEGYTIELDWKHLNGSVINLKHIEPLKAQRAKKNADGTVTEYVKIDTCHLQPHKSAVGRIIKSDVINKWKNPLTGEEKYLYIPLDRYAWNEDVYSLEEDRFQQLVTAINMICKRYKAEIPTIHGVKKHYLDKLTDEWMPIDEWYKEWYSIIKNANRKLFKLASWSNNNWTMEHVQQRCLALIKKHNLFPRSKEFFLLLDWRNFADNVRHRYTDDALPTDLTPWEASSIGWVAQWFGIRERAEEPEELWKRVTEAHPMLQYIDIGWQDDSKTAARVILNYLQR